MFSLLYGETQQRTRTFELVGRVSLGHFDPDYRRKSGVGWTYSETGRVRECTAAFVVP